MFSGEYNIVGNNGNGEDVYIGADGVNVKGNAAHDVWVCEDKGNDVFVASNAPNPSTYLGHGNTNNAKLMPQSVELKAEDCGEGYYMFKSTESGLYLTLSDNPTDNVKFAEKDPVKPPKQKFIVVPIVHGGGYVPNAGLEPEF
ncbi:MAG: hypothetical protein JXQ87_19130 [Bacteroidia bacterium]